MECDWEVQIGPDAPLIDAAWPGFVDLVQTPERAHELPEAFEFPALGPLLSTLNSTLSSVWTSKCDFWPSLAPEDFNADELAAAAGSSSFGVACYVDLLPRSSKCATAHQIVDSLCKPWCTQLRTAPLRACRVDFVVRQAIIDNQTANLGITAYVTACGSTSTEAKLNLAKALAALGDALGSNSTLQ